MVDGAQREPTAEQKKAYELLAGNNAALVFMAAEAMQPLSHWMEADAKLYIDGVASKVAEEISARGDLSKLRIHESDPAKIRKISLMAAHLRDLAAISSSPSQEEYGEAVSNIGHRVALDYRTGANIPFSYGNRILDAVVERLAPTPNPTLPTQAKR